MRRSIAFIVVTLTTPAFAHDPEEPEEVIVHGEEQRDAASSITVSRREIELRPHWRMSDLVETVPGTVAVQHAGGGKANQFFLRGFDADHGTDVALFVDGLPINLVSHGHGQGYADTSFIIPELVVHVDGWKGPYRSELGDFATAGAIRFRLAEAFEKSFAQLSVGNFGIARGLVVASPRIADDWRFVVAGEAYTQDGPFSNPEDFGRGNVFAKLTHDFGTRTKASLTWMSYAGSWRASGQLPERAICGEGEVALPPPSTYGAACIDRFGAVDPTDGGSSQRHVGMVDVISRGSFADVEATFYAMRYDFRLFSNFTFFADDASRGDQIEQDDDRTMLGGSFVARNRTKAHGIALTTSVGMQARHDSIDNALWHTQAQARVEPRTQAAIAQTALGMFVDEDVRLTKALRFRGGARVDRIDATVDGALPGSTSSAQFSPKLTVTVSPTKWLDLFADWGRGFHSNDARGAVQPINPARLLTPATGYELGASLHPAKGFLANAAFFLLDLDSELVWSGDTGTTEPSGRTRRFGAELGARWHQSDWLMVDADLTVVDARYRDTNALVPLAPRVTATAGVSVRHEISEFVPFASLRLKAIGDRPANEDASLIARGFVQLDAQAGIRWRSLELSADAYNLTNTDWRAVSFATTSRLAYEPQPITGIHYTPGWPFTILGRFTVYVP